MNSHARVRKDVALEIDPIVHEDYNNPLSTSNDIALLKLAEPVDLNIYTPACLADLDADYTGQSGRVYGDDFFYRGGFPYQVFLYQVGDLWPPALPRAQMSCRKWR